MTQKPDFLQVEDLFKRQIRVFRSKWDRASASERKKLLHDLTRETREMEWEARQGDQPSVHTSTLC